MKRKNINMIIGLIVGIFIIGIVDATMHWRPSMIDMQTGNIFNITDIYTDSGSTRYDTNDTTTVIEIMNSLKANNTKWLLQSTNQTLSYDNATDYLTLVDGGSVDLSELDTDTDTNTWNDSEDFSDTFVNITGDVMHGNLTVSGEMIINGTLKSESTLGYDNVRIGIDPSYPPTARIVFDDSSLPWQMDSVDLGGGDSYFRIFTRMNVELSLGQTQSILYSNLRVIGNINATGDINVTPGHDICIDGDKCLSETLVSGFGYTNISDLPTCAAGDFMTYDGTDLTCDTPTGGAAGGDKWLDGGAYIYPNSTYADNVIVHGYIKALDWTNVSISTAQVYNWTDIDTQATNQSLALNTNTLSLTGSVATVDLSGYLDNVDTVLNESTVDGFVADNGYITVQATNQSLGLTTNTLSLTGSVATVDLSSYLDNVDTVLNESTVDGFVANNGYVTSDNNTHATNQSLALNTNTLSLTGSVATVDLSSYLDNVDTVLNESTVDGMVADNGYVTVQATNQSISLSTNTLSLSGDAATVDLSGYLDNVDTTLNTTTIQGMVNGSAVQHTEMRLTSDTTNHRIHDNASCTIIEGDTVAFLVC